MATDWEGGLLAITTHLQTGSALAAAVDPLPRGDLTFINGLPLRLAGSDATTPVAWAAELPLRRRGVAIVRSFLGETVQQLLARGVPQGEATEAANWFTDRGFNVLGLIAARSVMKLRVGTRAEIRGRLLEFIAEHGYEVIPDGI